MGPPNGSNLIVMKIRDLQYPRTFLSNEIGLDPDDVSQLLDIDIEIHWAGELDTVVLRNGKIDYYNPSSITRFLYKILYHLLQPFADYTGKDKLALGLFYMVRNYVYSDFEPRDAGPPVVVSFDKITPAFIVHELIEPLVGAVPKRDVLFIASKTMNTCRVIKTRSELPSSDINFNLPLLAVNCNIHNTAAQHADLLYQYLLLGIGKDKSDKVIKNILLNGDGNDHILNNLFLLLKTLQGDPTYVMDFIEHLQASVAFSSEEMKISHERQRAAIQADNYLSQNIKLADDGRTTQVFRQWSQWSLLMGLIEKQLSPMRGSMWPASELVKPHEDAFKSMLKERAIRKNKNQLNFEEMLEAARDLYDHNAVEPGELIEVILKDRRVWKE